MIDNFYMNQMNNAFTEVYDIILHMDKNLKNKIPLKFINFIKDNRNINHIINIDYNKNINQQQILYDTKVILSVLYREYLVDEQTKIKLQKEDQLAIERKYNYDNIFKNKKNTPLINTSTNSKETDIITYKEKSFFRNLIEKIKNIFKR